jgi:outer membrane receptor protein involved in Fe transport
VKGRFFDRRLTLAAAAFYYDYRNQQVQDTRAGPVSFLVNAPKSQIYGLDGEATLRITPDLSLNGSLGLLHAEYQSLVLQGTNLAGNTLPFAPKVTAQLGFDWRIATVAGGDLRLTPTVSYFGQQYFSPFDAINAPGSGQVNAELQQKAYALANASLTWTRGRVTLRLWSNNLFDAKVLGYGLDLRGAGFPYNFLVPDPPRTFGAQARLAF